MTDKAHVPPSTGSKDQPVRVHCWQCNHSEGSLPSTWTLCDICFPLFGEAQSQDEPPVLATSTGSGVEPSQVHCAGCGYSEENLPSTWILCDMCLTQFEVAQSQGVPPVFPPTVSSPLRSEDPPVSPPVVPGILPEEDPYNFVSHFIGMGLWWDPPSGGREARATDYRRFGRCFLFFTLTRFSEADLLERPATICPVCRKDHPFRQCPRMTGGCFHCLD